MKKLSNRSYDSLIGVNPRLAHVLMFALDQSTSIDFVIICGVRTSEEQNDLYQIGRRGIKSERIVTNCDGVQNLSNHQLKPDGTGHAVDILCLDAQGRGTYTPDYYTKVAAFILTCASQLGIPVKWGGTFKSKDLPHFELID